MNKVVMVSTIAGLLILCGCQKQEPDNRLVEVAVKQDKQKDDIGKMAERVQGFERRVGGIEESVGKVAAAAGAPQAAKTEETTATEPKVVEFKDAPEYKQIMAQLSAVQQQLTATEQELAQRRQEAATQQEQDRLRDPGAAWQAVTNPQEMTRRLDLLAQNFGQGIQDTARRQQFEADVLQLKRGMLENLSPQQLYQRATADLTQRLNQEQDQRAREFVQRQLQELQSASGEDLQGRLDRYSRFQNFRQLRDLQQKYDIPRDAFSNAGLPAVGGDQRRAPGGNTGRRGGPGGGN